MTKFQVGQSYATRSICDYDCIHSFQILARTEKTVTVEVNGIIVRRGVRTWDDGVEVFSPFGRYSMSATIAATDSAMRLAGGT
jgi:hypothetical protein